MKFKDYLNSLVSRRKSNISISKPNQKSINTKNHQDSIPSADCHYDICGYEDINGIVTDDQHSRTQILLARHAELVNTIVEARSSQENPFSSCTQCRSSHQSSPMIPPPPPQIPPPLPPKLSLDQHLSFSNRNYSSTLATCSPRRECHHQQQTQQSYHHHHPAHLISSQYSTPNPNVMTSSSNSLWTTTASLSKKQRSKIRTNPWIGNTLTNSRQSTFIESQNLFQHEPSPPIPTFSQPEYGIYDSTLRTSPPGLIHSESFPQTTSNGNIHQINSPPPPPSAPTPAPTSSVILHQSDSGHGFSLSSSRVINSSSSSSSSSASSSPPSSSSSPANTSGDGVLLNDKQNYRQKKLKKKISSISPPSLMKRSPKHNINTEQYFCPNTISSDSGSLTRRTKAQQASPPVTLQYRYQRPSNMTKTNSPTKSPIDRINQKHHSRSSSSRSIDDHFSLEFEEILENERSNKQRKDKQSSTTKLVSPTTISSRKSPFILPLDETNIKLSSPPPPLIFSPTLTKTNSRAILKHIEEIENEIRLIKNLDVTNDDDDDDDEYVLSPRAYPEDDIDLGDENDDDDHQNNNDPIEIIKDERQSIYEQVDQWVEKCLNTSNNTNNSADLLHAECDRLSDTIKDYVVCVCSNDDQQSSPIPTPVSPKKTTKLMTAFYLSSIPTRTTKRTSSFINQPIKLENTQTGTDHLKSIHECPF